MYTVRMLYLCSETFFYFLYISLHGLFHYEWQINSVNKLLLIISSIYRHAVCLDILMY